MLADTKHRKRSQNFIKAVIGSQGGLGHIDGNVLYLFLQKQKIEAQLHIPLGRYVPYEAV